MESIKRPINTPNFSIGDVVIVSGGKKGVIVDKVDDFNWGIAFGNNSDGYYLHWFFIDKIIEKTTEKYTPKMVDEISTKISNSRN